MEWGPKNGKARGRGDGTASWWDQNLKKNILTGLKVKKVENHWSKACIVNPRKRTRHSALGIAT